MGNYSNHFDILQVLCCIWLAARLFKGRCLFNAWTREQTNGCRSFRSIAKLAGSGALHHVKLHISRRQCQQKHLCISVIYLLMFLISNFTHKNKQKQFKTKKVFVRFNMFATLLSLYWKWLRNEKWKITQASINWACVGFFFKPGWFFKGKIIETKLTWGILNSGLLNTYTCNSRKWCCGTLTHLQRFCTQFFYMLW